MRFVVVAYMKWKQKYELFRRWAPNVLRGIAVAIRGLQVNRTNEIMNILPRAPCTSDMRGGIRRVTSDHCTPWTSCVCLLILV